jgi:hypothetical protein
MPLPDRPNLEYLKKLAKDRLHDLQRVNPSAQLLIISPNPKITLE